MGVVGQQGEGKGGSGTVDVEDRKDEDKVSEEGVLEREGNVL